MTKKVGLVVHSGAHLFSNGILQNAYYIYQCLEHTGMKCELLCYEPEPKPFGYKGLELKVFSENIEVFNPSDYFLIMTVTRSINKSMYDRLKRYNVKVAAFICGNCVMFDIEDFVRGPRSKESGFIDQNSMTDELWVIPSFAPSLDYLTTLRKKPGKTVPHLWSPEIIREYTERVFKKEEKDLFYNPKKHTGKKIQVLILESNMAVLKNAWIPMMACEKLHLENPDLFEFIFVFNYPESNYAWNMADSLTIDKDKKLRRFNRLALPEILLKFNEDQAMPIILSYQLNNTLNYLYYEALHYGYPLVHNSPDLDGCGYYYPEFNLTKCCEQIMEAYICHNDNFEDYKKKSKKYLKRVDPFDKDVQKIWKKRIDDLMKKKD